MTPQLESTSFPFPQFLHPTFADAFVAAVDLANANGAPVGIWTRDGLFAVDVRPPDDEDIPETDLVGWTFHAVVDPDDQDTNREDL